MFKHDKMHWDLPVGLVYDRIGPKRFQIESHKCKTVNTVNSTVTGKGGNQSELN